MNLLDSLRESRNTISKAEHELISLNNENAQLKIMLWRMIQKHGATRFTEPIDETQAENIIASKFYIDENGCVVYSKLDFKSDENSK